MNRKGAVLSLTAWFGLCNGSGLETFGPRNSDFFRDSDFEFRISVQTKKLGAIAGNQLPTEVPNHFAFDLINTML